MPGLAGGNPEPAKEAPSLQEAPAISKEVPEPQDRFPARTEPGLEESERATDQPTDRDPAPAPFPKVAPYSLRYETEISGFHLKSQRTLSIESDGSFKLSGKAAMLFIAIEEYSVFNQTDSGQLQPREYFYDRKGLGDKKDYHIHFDWQAMKVTNLLKRDPWHLGLEEGMQDMLSHQEQFRLELVHSPPAKPYRPYRFTIVKKKKIKEYEYTPVAEEIISTAAGKLRTIRFEKYEDSPDRHTTVWLAADWGYVIARLEYIKGDSVQRMEISGGTISGREITPIAE